MEGQRVATLGHLQNLSTRGNPTRGVAAGTAAPGNPTRRIFPSRKRVAPPRSRPGR